MAKESPLPVAQINFRQTNTVPEVVIGRLVTQHYLLVGVPGVQVEIAKAPASSRLCTLLLQLNGDGG